MKMIPQFKAIVDFLTVTKRDIVVISNSREKLFKREFYCSISTEAKTYTEIFRAYKNNFLII